MLKVKDLNHKPKVVLQLVLKHRLKLELSQSPEQELMFKFRAVQVLKLEQVLIKLPQLARLRI